MSNSVLLSISRLPLILLWRVALQRCHCLVINDGPVFVVSVIILTIDIIFSQRHHRPPKYSQWCSVADRLSGWIIIKPSSSSSAATARIREIISERSAVDAQLVSQWNWRIGRSLLETAAKSAWSKEEVFGEVKVVNSILLATSKW